MKFTLRKKSGVNGTEVKISVFFSPEETEQGLTSVRDDNNIHLSLLRVEGDDYLRADHALMVLRTLVHYADLWSMRDNPAIAQYLTHGVMRREALAQAVKPRKKRKLR